MPWIEFYPLWGEHEIYMIIIFVCPIFQHFPQIKLGNNFMGRNEGVHVCFESQLRIYTFLIKFDFDEIVGVCTNDKIHFSPIDHYYFFDIIHYVWQLLSIDFINTFVVLTRLEISM